VASNDARMATFICIAIAVVMIIARGQAGANQALITVIPLAVLFSYQWVYAAGVKRGREDAKERTPGHPYEQEGEDSG
jgi:hypothetical protein